MDEIQKYLRIAYRRKWSAIAVFGSVVAASVLFIIFATPIYEAGGQLLLRRSSKASSIGDIGEKLGQLDALGSQSSPVITEIQVIRSMPIGEKIITELNLRDNRGVRLEFADFSKALRVVNTRQTDVIEVAYKDINREQAAAIVNKLFELYIQNDISNNRQEAQAARIFIEKQLPQVEETVKQAELYLREFKESNGVIDLTAESKSSVETISELNKEFFKVKSELASTTVQSESLKKSLGLNSDTAFLISSPSIQQVLEELQQIGQKIAVEKARYRDENPVILDLRQKQSSLMRLLEQRVGQETAGKLQEPADRISQVSTPQQDLINNFVKVEAERLGLVAKSTSISNLLIAYQDRTTLLPKLEQKQRALERRLKVAQSTYEILLARLQSVRIAENQTVGNVRIIAPAVIPRIDDQIFPRKSLILGFATVFGFLAAGLVVIVSENLDRSIKTIDEIRDLSVYPIMGIIPNFNHSSAHKNSYSIGKSSKNLPSSAIATKASQLIVRDAPRSPITESFRILQTNLQFSNSDNSLKVLVVTSSVPQEGKSTTAANLALTMADLGKRVLLIDVDMRKPSQHKAWQLDNKLGLSNILTDQNTLAEVLHTYDKESDLVSKNVDIVTSGPIPPNPVTLIQSKRMAELVEMASREYDFVILDSPPATVAADASILGKIANGILLVVRPEVADSGSFIYTKRVLEQSEQNVLGLVINGVTPENNSYSYNYYYYMSSYYGEDAKPEAGFKNIEAKNKM
jgi:capsular exopolysaccharide synthesis family protein